MSERPIGREDLEGKLRQIKSAVDETAEQAKSATTAIAIGAVVLILVVYLLGRRKGRKTKGARLEIYRL